MATVRGSTSTGERQWCLFGCGLEVSDRPRRTPDSPIPVPQQKEGNEPTQYRQPRDEQVVGRIGPRVTLGPIRPTTCSSRGCRYWVGSLPSFCCGTGIGESGVRLGRSDTSSPQPNRHHCLSPVEVEPRTVAIHHREIKPQRLHGGPGHRLDAEPERVPARWVGLVEHLSGVAKDEGPLLGAGNRPDAVVPLRDWTAVQIYVATEADGAGLIGAGVPLLAVRDDAAE